MFSHRTLGPLMTILLVGLAFSTPVEAQATDTHPAREVEELDNLQGREPQQLATKASACPSCYSASYWTYKGIQDTIQAIAAKGEEPCVPAPGGPWVDYLDQYLACMQDKGELAELHFWTAYSTCNSINALVGLRTLNSALACTEDAIDECTYTCPDNPACGEVWDAYYHYLAAFPQAEDCYSEAREN